MSRPIPAAPARAATGEQRPTAGQSRRNPHRLNFTKSELDKLLKNGRPQRQRTIWDSGQDGLCVLVSRGPRHKRLLDFMKNGRNLDSASA
jgi:hypothetical protein